MLPATGYTDGSKTLTRSLEPLVSFLGCMGTRGACSGSRQPTALAHYRNVASYMRQKGMEPVVTILHSVLPVWLSGKVLTPGFINHYAFYATTVV
jgi:hypothetical protein